MAEADPQFHIVTVDDEEDILEILEAQLASLGCPVRGFQNPQEALAHIAAHADSVLGIISDLQMPGLDGLQLGEKVKELDSQIPFFIFSGFVTAEVIKKAKVLSVLAILEKPASQEEFLDCIREHIEKRKIALQEKLTIRAIFIEECREYLDGLEKAMMELEDTQNQEEKVNLIFRLIHTIKGSSAIFSAHSLSKYSHSVENLLSALKEKRVSVSPTLVAVLLKSVDVMREMTSNLGGGVYASYDIFALAKPLILLENDQVEQAAKFVDLRDSAANEERDYIRVPIKTLDEFMKVSGEITVVRNVITKLAASLDGHYSTFQDLSLVSSTLENMYKRVVEMRKVRLTDVYRPLGRIVKDLSLSLNKSVKLQLLGDSLRVDTSLSRVIADCLSQIIRNCMDHGIETTDERRAAGKLPTGQITITSSLLRNLVQIEIRDDGRGIDTASVKKKALEKGLISASDAERMSDREIISMIFEPGFSTAASVTSVSGRGVGMDMVKSSAVGLGGEVEISSQRGVGTVLTLTLPIPESVTIMRIVLVKSGERQFGLPQENIEHILEISDANRSRYIRQTEGGQFLLWNSRLVPILSLSKIIGGKSFGPSGSKGGSCQSEERDEPILVIFSDHSSCVALAADELGNNEEVVVKPFCKILNGLHLYSGASLVTSGHICPIISFQGLVEVCQAEERELASGQNEVADRGNLLMDDYLLFSLNTDSQILAISTRNVHRLERFSAEEVQQSGATRVVPYNGKTLPLYDTSALLGFAPLVGFESNIGDNSTPLAYPTIVIAVGAHLAGFVVRDFEDIKFLHAHLQKPMNQHPAFEANLCIEGTNYPVVSLEKILPSSYTVRPVALSRHVASSASDFPRQRGILWS